MRPAVKSYYFRKDEEIGTAVLQNLMWCFTSGVGLETLLPAVRQIFCLIATTASLCESWAPTLVSVSCETAKIMITDINSLVKVESDSLVFRNY
jgi:hypothetical protein